MNRVRTLPLVAALLVGCTAQKPVNVVVPQGEPILHGTYLGEAAEYWDDQETGARLAVQLAATATYVSAEHYRASGTLKLGDTTYDFTGTGQGNFLVRLTPQYSPPQPGIDFTGDLLLGGQKVGTLKSSYLHSPGDTSQNLTLRMGEGWERWYRLKLERQN